MNDKFIDNFIKSYYQGIFTIFNLYLKGENFEFFLKDLKHQLCQQLDLIEDKNLSEDETKNYLFYFVNSFSKKNKTNFEYKNIKYLCPACLTFDKNSILEDNFYLKCHLCEEKLKSSKDIKDINFYTAFYKHSKSGFRCKECQRFIPKKENQSDFISCPYLDCCFSGSLKDLKKMHHPSTKDDIEVKKIQPLSKLKDNNHKIISNIIEDQSNRISYSSNNFNLKHRLLVYKAFSNLLDKNTKEMCDYLLNDSRSGGFQHKIFQEYIYLLEKSLPFIIKKNKKNIVIDNLLDKNLSLFDGISTFEGIVNDSLIIKNETKEFYIGGRKASYTKPYYIGKLLSVINSETKEPMNNFVKDYSFLKINMKDVAPNTKVIVTHLRVPPHYQMGGMVHVNRVRKNIVDAAKGF